MPGKNPEKTSRDRDSTHLPTRGIFDGLFAHFLSTPIAVSVSSAREANMGCSPSRNSSASDDDFFCGRHSYAYILSEVCAGSGGVEGQTATTYGDASTAVPLPDGELINRDEVITIDRDCNNSRSTSDNT